MLTVGDWMDTRPWIDDESIDIVGYLRGARIPFSEEDVQLLTSWRQDGFVILRNAASHEVIDAFLADLEWGLTHPDEVDCEVEVRGLQLPMSEVSHSDLWTEGTKFISLQSFSRAAMLLSLTPRVQRFLSLVFLEPAAVLQSLTFWRGSQQAAHIDYPYVRTQNRLAQMAASWIALEDIKPGAGPLWYYRGSHKPEVSGFFDWGGGSIVLEPDSVRSPREFSDHLYQRIQDAQLTPEIFLPNKGDALIWHGNLVHEGSPVLDPGSTRRSYVTHYTAESCFPEGFRPPRLIEGVNGMDAKPGLCWEYPWDVDKQKLPSWHNAALTNGAAG